ncbi:MAG: Gfo/Idh/MocA family oxidoreductase [Kiritimatiellae bacterium]|nr:Gfo/Idh/MocA family oxidoreductase [Verrucomicrobiota bacterium]MCG2660496.1 Gfo/Idh/MocA family oxidoreductase [Kiritimatiellia bacterium]
MPAKIKWGVIGCGGIAARRTIPEFKKMVSNAELVSVMDISAERARAVAQQFGIPHWCTTEKELLRQSVDAVYIATPPNMHCRQVIQAAKAGKHILCEKPVAVSIREIDRMEAACQAAQVKFMLGFCMHHNVYNKKARDLVQSGALGQMVMGRAELTCWYPPIPGAWRQDLAVSHGGALIDMGTHCLDILEWIMDTRIVEVTGFQDQRTHKYPTPIEDTSTILVRFGNGAHGIIDNYFNIPDAAAQNSLELYGTKGTLIGQGTIGQDPTGKMFSILQAEETGYDANQVRNVEAQRQEYRLEGIGLYGQMIDIFSRCIMDNTAPSITLADGRHSVAVVLAIYEAIRKRKVVKVRE